MASQLIVRACPPFRVPGQDPARVEAALERDARQFLDPAELERARAMTAVPRQDFLAARLAQRLFAAELLGVRAQDLTARYSCPRCGSGPGITQLVISHAAIVATEALSTCSTGMRLDARNVPVNPMRSG